MLIFISDESIVNDSYRPKTEGLFIGKKYLKKADYGFNLRNSGSDEPGDVLICCYSNNYNQGWGLGTADSGCVYCSWSEHEKIVCLITTLPQRMSDHASPTVRLVPDCALQISRRISHCRLQGVFAGCEQCGSVLTARRRDLPAQRRRFFAAPQRCATAFPCSSVEDYLLTYTSLVVPLSFPTSFQPLFATVQSMRRQAH